MTQFEELIELLRTKEADMQVSRIPLPPQGRLSVWNWRCPRCWNYYKNGETKGMLCKKCEGNKDKEQGLAETIRTS